MYTVSRIWSERRTEQIQESKRRASEARGAPLVPEQAFFKCPRCAQWTSAGRKGFQHDNLHQRVHCGGCKRSHVAGRWLCKCNKAWVACSAHAEAPESTRAFRVEEKRLKEAIGGKRRKTEAEKQVWVEASTKTRKRSREESLPAEVLLVKKLSRTEALIPRVLSAGLKRKFPHLVQV